MVFSALNFLFFFLPIVFGVYWVLSKTHSRTLCIGWLVLASLIFYAWWHVGYVWVILVSLLFNFIWARWVLRGKYSLAVGIAVNLLFLAYFKYSGFFLGEMGLQGQDVLLPLAISFFTFQQVAYLVDVYRNRDGLYPFLDYSLFVTFFPQLIAGPIVHHAEMMPQFKHCFALSPSNVRLGMAIFAVGLFKKVLLADTFSVWADAGYAASDQLSCVEAWVTSLSYTLQLYFDFSGYADMAIGLALLFNIHLPLNFNSPYQALSIQDFWRRWHITLSRFLRDYLYIPLGGNRKGVTRKYLNVMITMLLGGLWHGAGWTFVLWGGLHGLGLVIHACWARLGVALPKPMAWFLTFNFVNIGWVLFRAEDFGVAQQVLSAMFDFSAPVVVDWMPLAYLALGVLIVLSGRNVNERIGFMLGRYATVFLLAMALLQVNYYAIHEHSAPEFLYFNF